MHTSLPLLDVSEVLWRALEVCGCVGGTHTGQWLLPGADAVDQVAVTTMHAQLEKDQGQGTLEEEDS